MPFKKNDYIKHKEDGSLRRILSIYDGIVHISDYWGKEEAHRNLGGLEKRQRCTDIHFTLDELNAYFEPATPTEAGFPEEEEPLVLKGVTGLRWRPTVGQWYSYMAITSPAFARAFFKANS